MTTKPEPAKPAHEDPKPVARTDTARPQTPYPEHQASTESAPYPGEHYDTPNPYSPETIADEQRKRSDHMAATAAKAAKAKDDHKEPLPPLKK